MAPASEAGPAANPAALQPSRELSHVRYIIDASVEDPLRTRLVDLLVAYGAETCNLQPPLAPARQAENGNPDTLMDGQDTVQAASTSTASESASADANVDLKTLTHVVTMNMDFKYADAVHAHNNRILAEAETAKKQVGTAPTANGMPGELIAVVTPLWVTRTCDNKKRQDEQFFSPDPRKIFSGITVCTEGLPPGDSEAVKGIVAALGGQWRGPLVAEVTHLVCLNMEGKKCQRLLGSGLRLGMKAVLPYWIDDCIKLHLRVPEEPYLFPNPPCEDTVIRDSIPYKTRLEAFFTRLGKPVPVVANHSNSVLDPHVLDGESQRSEDGTTKTNGANGIQAPTDVFSGKAIYISQSCDLSARKLQSFLLKIKAEGGEALAGGTIGSSKGLLQRADIVVVNHRAGWEFWQAYEQNKTIGNLDWLIHALFTALRTHGQVAPPTAHLLHYPWPLKPVPAFANANFTVSGYAGPARETVKRMIELLGGVFEGTLTRGKTTHLIASVQSGSKVSHATHWGIPVINHFWIEDCFVQWGMLETSSAKYSNFDQKAIEQDLPAFIAGREVSMSEVAKWASSSEVQEERTAAIASLDDAMVDEMDKAEEEALLSSQEEEQESTPPPPPTKKPNPAPTFQQLNAMPSNESMDIDSGISQNPETILEGMIAQSQYPPPASDNPSEAEASAVAHALVEKPRSKKASPMAPVETSTPNGLSHTVKAGPLEPPSSVSTIQGNVDTGLIDRKRKRSSLAGLGDPDMSQNISLGYVGRKAAAAASQKLHDTIMPDLVMFEREKRNGGGRHLDEMFGGRVDAPSSSNRRRSSASAKNTNGHTSAHAGSTSGSDLERRNNGTSPAPLAASTSKRGRPRATAAPLASSASKAIKGRGGRGKPPPEPAAEEDEEEGTSSFDEPPRSKPVAINKLSKTIRSGGKIFIAATGTAVDDKTRKKLGRMGAKFLGDNITNCSHIVVRGISRTVKFLTAICLGVYFVSEDWAIDSAAQGQFLDEEPYILRDKEGEKKHDMNLARSLVRAKRGKIFDDQTFYISPQATPTFDALKQIAESGGGKVYKRIPTSKMISDKADVFVVSSQEERGVWEKLASEGVDIYSGEAIIKAVLQQELHFDQYTLSG